MSVNKSPGEVTNIREAFRKSFGTDLVRTQQRAADTNYTTSTFTLGTTGLTTDVGILPNTQEMFIVDATTGTILLLPKVGKDTEQFPPQNPPVMGPPLSGPELDFPQGPTPEPPIIKVGSGKIFSRFQGDDVIPNQQEVVTRALWSCNEGNLTTFATSSVQTQAQKRYYYEITNGDEDGCCEEPQFSIAYGHVEGSGSSDDGAVVQLNDTPSRAIYGQYRLLCLNGQEEVFTIGGEVASSIYAINVNRARMREYLDEGNLEINLAHLSGSQFISGGGSNSEHTGSNVQLLGNDAVLRLVDDSRINPATMTQAGEVYQMVSGSLEGGVYNPSEPVVYGHLYRRLGIIILNGDKLDDVAGFETVVAPEVDGDNAYKMVVSMQGAAELTDESGDPLGFQARSVEKVKSTHYFCRVKNAEYNFSNNPTFVTGSLGDLVHPSFINDPKVYITTVGLYNDKKELVAVAKMSKALFKSFTREALIRVKLEF